MVIDARTMAHKIEKFMSRQYGSYDEEYACRRLCYYIIFTTS